ncbi:MAG TPA: NAD(P)/FAD-dependent oxidoreductase, partial [Verrucomicrobiae bacterium]|nr:NAD(P)/FAD-dependent oxidoreductase [Verrucomicrobiae bacterium]
MNMKTEEQFDLIILGSGSTGFAAALRAEEYGARVLMIEKSAMGGTCINWGCVPSKTLIHAALFAHEARLAGVVGIPFTEGEIDHERLAQHKLEVVRGLRKAKYMDILTAIPGLSLVKGTARIVGPGEVAVGEAVFRSDRILIATGGAPRVPVLKGLQETDWMTSREALLLKRLPRSVVVIGGGVIAVELGQMFRRLGTSVTLVERGEMILPSVEREPVRELTGALLEEGVEVVTGAAVCRAFRSGEESCVEALVGGETRVLSAEKLLLAVGTAPATAGLGLENVGVDL